MEEHDDEESVISTVFNPIFFSDDASVTETEREKEGRTGATEAAKEVEEEEQGCGGKLTERFNFF